MTHAMALKGLDYARVELLDSRWKGQRTDTVELYLAHLSNDEVLHETRRLAGIPSYVNGQPGWGPSIGQYLGAYAKLYSATGDMRIYDKCIGLFRGWAACAEKCPAVYDHGTYVYEKFLGGLLDMYEYMHIEEVAPHISILTDHAMENFDPSIPRDGLQDARMKGQIEWYTLPENLYRAGALLGDDKYGRFADIWLYDYLWDKVLAGDFKIGPRHAYSHVNCLSSAVGAYLSHGEKKYLDVAIRAYDEILARHTYATGGYGPAETLFGDNPGYLGDALLSPFDFGRDPEGITYENFAGQVVARSDAWGSCEVSCCAWAVFKLCHYLLRITGDARFGAWAEKMLINGTGGQIPITKEGKVFYYANYFVDGAVKSVEDRRLTRGGGNHQWQCCTGTFPQDVAEYANMLYYQAEDSLCVSQFLPSRLRTEVGGTPVGLDALSRFPEEPRVRFLIHADAPVAFTLKLRVPAWAHEGVQVFINDEPVDIPCAPNTWAELPRTWREGDVVRMELPFSLYFVPVDEQHPDVAALMFGPVTLACTEMTVLTGDMDRPGDWIKPVEGELHIFETLPGHAGRYPHITRTFIPYYKIGEMRWYYMYNRIYPNNEALKNA